MNWLNPNGNGVLQTLRDGMCLYSAVRRCERLLLGAEPPFRPESALVAQQSFNNRGFSGSNQPKADLESAVLHEPKAACTCPAS